MKVNADWVNKNWQWVIFVSLLIFVIPTGIIYFATMDNDLWYSDQRKKLADVLTTEMKSINLPQKTAINKFHETSKSHQVFVYTRYRTELDEKEFVNYFIRELKKRNWIYYGKEYSEYKFCRGKFDADLTYQNDGGLFSKDNGKYYELSFSKGLRPLFDFSYTRPESCY